MNADRFWSLIEQARTNGRNCEAIAERLEKLLAGLTPTEIIGFDTMFSTLVAEAYRWDLWAVAYIANGGCSDDGFEYFRCWLIGQGRDRFELAMTSAARAVDGVKPDDDVECEDLLYVASTAYEHATGAEIPSNPVRGGEPVGDKWEEDDLPDLFPELCERFG